MASENKKIEVLVADTTAFIKNAPLQNLAIKVVTVPDVVNEVKNKRQLSRLVVLPYDLEVKEVFPENLKAVTDFSIKTGDYRSLSLTDLKVMALTYQLEKEKVGLDHIRVEPVQQLPTVVMKGPAAVEQQQKFAVPDFLDKSEQEAKGKEEMEKLPEACLSDEEKFKRLAAQIDDMDCDDILAPVNEESGDEESGHQEAGNEEKAAVMEEGCEEEDEDSDDGWITPENMHKFKTRMAMEDNLNEEKHVAVACMTTDYAMQNVLKQMNLNVAALDGRIIKNLRIFIFRCYACFKLTRNMTLQFCPKCGNRTLKKVGTSLGEDGKLIVHLNPRKNISAKGKRNHGSMPKIRGGKHSNNPLLVPDQPMPHDMPSRVAKTKTNAFADDYLGVISGYSPFSLRDTCSRSALLRAEANKLKRNSKQGRNHKRY